LKIFFISAFKFIVGTREIEYSIPVFRKLKQNSENYDLLISIALPIGTHFGVRLAKIFNNKLSQIYVADYGDPYYHNPVKNINILHKFLEKFILNGFDYITVPTDQIVSSYKYFKNINKIKVIPQGFPINKIKIAKYKKNKVPTIGYAGCFYKDIRNPILLFEHLVNVKYDCRLLLFTDRNNLIDMGYADYLKNKRIVVKGIVPREKCLYELSKSDFVINIENYNSNQVPSKLIDYAIIKRPIYSFNQSTFDRDLFNKFVSGKSKSNISVDISKYDIIKIAQQFVELAK
jgi:hypothetical protein